MIGSSLKLVKKRNHDICVPAVVAEDALTKCGVATVLRRHHHSIRILVKYLGIKSRIIYHWVVLSEEKQARQSQLRDYLVQRIQSMHLLNTLKIPHFAHDMLVNPVDREAFPWVEFRVELLAQVPVEPRPEVLLILIDVPEDQFEVGPAKRPRIEAIPIFEARDCQLLLVDGWLAEEGGCNERQVAAASRSLMERVAQFARTQRKPHQKQLSPLPPAVLVVDVS